MGGGRRQTRRRAIRALALAPLLFGCGDGEPSAPPPSAQPVAGEFETVCRALRESDDPYYGELPARRLARWIAAAQAGRIEARPAQMERAVIDLAGELLELGRAEQALELLATARAPSHQEPTGDARPDAEAGLSNAAAAPEPRAGGDAVDASLRVRRLAIERNAHLRAGEDQNCVLRHAAASCIVPFEPEALHADPAHARRAGDLSLEILALRPSSVSARWLLNIARMVSGDHPEGVPEPLRLPEAAFTSEEAFPRWRDRAHELGVDAFDLAGGAIMDDFDGDGLLDLVSSTADPCDGLKAYRNDGRGGFEDVAEAWGLAEQLGGLNLVHGDVDGDGRLDLLVLRGGWLGPHGEMRNSLLRNELAGAEGRFVDVTRAAGLAEPAAPTQTAAFADYDGDGDLDLYVGNEAWGERRYPSQLLRNRGDGTFRDVTREAGVENLRFAKGVAWGDFDDDGDPDLYVSNIGPNRLYRNGGDGTFRDVAGELGVREPAGRSFATWFFDFDNDGRLDLFVADYGALPGHVMASYLGTTRRGGHPRVYRNEKVRFAEVSDALGIARPMLPMGANHGDVDGDGWPDVYLGTGNPSWETLVPNRMLRNVGGARFAEVGFAGGFAHLQKGHGVAFGDIDNDGDQDLFHQLGGFYPGDRYGNALFENPGVRTRWLTLRLEGRRANRFGVGARIAVRVRDADGTRTIHALADSGGSFGGNSLQQEIGLGRAEAIEELRIRWPGSGSEQRFRGVVPDRIYRAVEGEAELVPLDLPRLRLGGVTPGHPSAPHAVPGQDRLPRRPGAG